MIAINFTVILLQHRGAWLEVRIITQVISCARQTSMMGMAHGAGADLRGAPLASPPLLFSQRQGRVRDAPPLFFGAAFLLKKCLRPPPPLKIPESALVTCGVLLQVLLGVSPPFILEGTLKFVKM